MIAAAFVILHALKRGSGICGKLHDITLGLGSGWRFESSAGGTRYEASFYFSVCMSNYDSRRRRDNGPRI